MRSIVGRFLEHSPGDVLRQRRRAGVVARQRRPHAPQPRPPGRGAAAGLRRDRPRPAARDDVDAAMAPGVRCWELGSDGELDAHRGPRLPGRAPGARSERPLAEPPPIRRRRRRPLAHRATTAASRRWWCTGRSTTTGRCPRASWRPASTCWRRRCREVAEETGVAVVRRPAQRADPLHGRPTGDQAGRLLADAGHRRRRSRRTTRSTSCAGCRSTTPPRCVTHDHDRAVLADLARDRRAAHADAAAGAARQRGRPVGLGRARRPAPAGRQGPRPGRAGWPRCCRCSGRRRC